MNELLPQFQCYSSHYYRSALDDSDWIDILEQFVAGDKYCDTLDEAGFLVGYETIDDGNPRLDGGSEANPILVGFAMKTSVRVFAHASTWILHVDATYKTNTCSFPVLVIGISDAWLQ